VRRPTIPEGPRIEQGVSQADIAAYGELCFAAGRRYQRGRTTRMTTEEREAREAAAAAAARADAKTDFARELVSWLVSEVIDEDGVAEWARARVRAMEEEREAERALEAEEAGR
jgi:hypothetical protein